MNVRITRRVCALLVLLALAGCRKELYADLNEQDANQMVAALLEEGLDAEKAPVDGGKSWALRVDDQQTVRAMQVLRARGLPAPRYADMGEMFKKEGLVSTPSEERIRFIYGISQDLAGTIAQIDGVLVARVQIVLPNNDPLATAMRPASASVFVKYRPQFNVSAFVPQIKSLVSHSVEGLSYDQVSVAMVPAQQQDATLTSAQAPSAWPHLRLMIIAGVTLLLTGLALAYLWMRRISLSRTGIQPL